MNEQAKVDLVDLPEFDIAEFPLTDQRGRTWPAETADGLVESYAALAGDKGGLVVPMVFGHNEKPAGELTSGMPALGWVENVRKRMVDGKARIRAAVKRVPRKVADLLGAGAFRQVSLSWWPAGKAPGFPQVTDKPILRHLGLCGADPARQPQLGTLDNVAKLYAPSDPPPVPAAMAGGAEAAVETVLDLPAEMAAPTEAAAGAAETPPAETLSDAVQEQAAASRLQPVIRAIQDRLWTIEDKEGKTEAEKAAALRALGQEIVAFFEEYDAASPGETPAEEAAAATEGGDGTPAEQGGDAPESPVTVDPVSGGSGAAQGASDATRDKPGAPNRPVAPASDAARPAEMSAAAADAVSATIARLVGAGRLAPKHAPRLRAEAAACCAHGGDGAVYAYLDDEEARRSAQVVPLGETGATGAAGAAAMAGGGPTAAEASAAAEFDALGLGKSLGVTKEAYVKARCGDPRLN